MIYPMRDKPCQLIRQRRVLVLSAALSLPVLVLVSGCEEQRPITSVRLEVSQAGTYVLGGKPVKAPDLKQELQVLRSADKSLELHIVAADNANFQAVGQAVAVAEELGIKLSVSSSAAHPK